MKDMMNKRIINLLLLLALAERCRCCPTGCCSLRPSAHQRAIPGADATGTSGVPCKDRAGHSLSLALGYHHQEYNQLASFENTIFLTQYVEEISSHAITASIGCSF